MSDEPAVPSSPADSPDPGAAAPPVFAPYNPPAGGWGAVRATARALREQSVELKGSRALLSMNQPEGFDCPGCAWLTLWAGCSGIALVASAGRDGQECSDSQDDDRTGSLMTLGRTHAPPPSTWD